MNKEFKILAGFLTLILLLGSAGAYTIVDGGECTCSDCEDCSNALKDSACTVVKLNNNITNHAGYCIQVNATNTVFDCVGHVIDGVDKQFDYGIHVYPSSRNITIKNCEITDFYIGILVFHSSDNTLINNSLSSNEYGIEIDGSSNNTITNNNVSLNYVGIYILFSGSENNTVSNNYVIENTASGIYLTRTAHNRVYNNTVKGGNGGIYLHFTFNTTVTDNNVSSKFIAGIELYGSDNNTILNNTVCCSDYFGVYLSNANNNIVRNNIISNNTLQGIYLCDAVSNFIMDNLIENNSDGVWISNISPWGVYQGPTMNNTVQGNDIINNVGYGIYSQNSSSTINSNFVCGNINLDFNSSDWLSSSGGNNACDKPDGWNYNGIDGCWYTCSGLPRVCDLNNDGMIYQDWNDLMNAYKCFWGINKNCDKIQFQDLQSMKQEYECFVGNLIT